MPRHRLCQTAVILIMLSMAACSRSPESRLLGTWAFDFETSIQQYVLQGASKRAIQQAYQDSLDGIKMHFGEGGLLEYSGPESEYLGEFTWHLLSVDGDELLIELVEKPPIEIDEETADELVMEMVNEFRIRFSFRVRFTRTHLILESADDPFSWYLLRVD